MTEKRIHRAASGHEISLYCHVGEAVCAVQYVEDALSHSIVLKVGAPPTKSEADQQLEKHQKYTLGKAIRIAGEKAIFSELIQTRLNKFLKERNWLIHKSIAHGAKALEKNENRNRMIDRIKAITKQAHELLEMIEGDLIDFAEASGKDMSRVKNEISKYYSERTEPVNKSV